MIDETPNAAPEAAPPRNISALLLAAGGVAAAFGAASCCTLPLLLAPRAHQALAETRLRPLSYLPAADRRGFGRARLNVCMSTPLILESTITCPSCGTAKAEMMPTDALPVLLRLHWLLGATASQAWRLLCVLLLRLGGLPAGSRKPLLR
jgi:hypothetical protein